MQVTWHTRDTVAGSKVSYGTSPQALTFSVTPTTDTSYNQSIFCAAPARFQPAEAEVVPLLQTTSEGGAFLTGTINNAVLTGLLPDMTYFFEVTVPGEAETRTGSFNTAPATLASASPAAVTRMLLVADGGQARVDGKRIADLSSFFFLDRERERDRSEETKKKHSQTLPSLFSFTFPLSFFSSLFNLSLFSLLSLSLSLSLRFRPSSSLRHPLLPPPSHTGAYQPDGNIWPYQALRLPLAGTWGTDRYSLIQLGVGLATQSAQQAAETVFVGLEAEVAAAAGRGAFFLSFETENEEGKKKKAHHSPSSLSTSPTTNRRALPRPSFQRRSQLRSRRADAVGQLV